MTQDTIIGTADRDSLNASPTGSIIKALGGNDFISGGDGPDTIFPGSNDGFDGIALSAGEDVINFAGANLGSYYSLETPFVAVNDSWSITVDGVNDTGQINMGSFGTTTLLNVARAMRTSFDDELVPIGLGGLTIPTSSEDDVIVAQAEQNHWLSFEASEGNDTYAFQGGYIGISYQSLGDLNPFLGVTIDLGAGTVDKGAFGSDVITSDLAFVKGTRQSDTMIGSSGDDTFRVRGGDTVDGKEGFDRLDFSVSRFNVVFADLEAGFATDTYVGFEGTSTHNITNIEWITGGRNYNDILLGSDADERFDGRGGNDSLNGRGGNDLLNGEDGDDVMYGGDGDDTLNGGIGNDRLNGGLGLDILNGDDGDDYIVGNFGADMIFGGTGVDDIRAGGSADTVDGGAGNDKIVGGRGTDVLFGGAGNDILTGGDGAGNGDNARDVFVFKSNAMGGGGFDIIRDFEDTRDKLDLSDMGYASFADVLADATDVGAHMEIDWDFAGVLRINNFSIAAFSEGDVIGL